jgi:hypothetical protein
METFANCGGAVLPKNAFQFQARVPRPRVGLDRRDRFTDFGLKSSLQGIGDFSRTGRESEEDL